MSSSAGVAYQLASEQSGWHLMDVVARRDATEARLGESVNAIEPRADALNQLNDEPDWLHAAAADLALHVHTSSDGMSTQAATTGNVVISCTDPSVPSAQHSSRVAQPCSAGSSEESSQTTLKQMVDRIKDALDIDSSMKIPVAIKMANEMMGLDAGQLNLPQQAEVLLTSLGV
jgi:hypothetical protein